MRRTPYRLPDQSSDRSHSKRSRNEFRAWLVWELNRRGANLAPQPAYTDLQAAVIKHFCEPTEHHVVGRQS